MISKYDDIHVGMDNRNIQITTIFSLTFFPIPMW